MVVEKAVLVLHIFFAIIVMGSLALSLSSFRRAVRMYCDGGGTSAIEMLSRNVQVYSTMIVVVMTLGLILWSLNGTPLDAWVLISIAVMLAVLAILFGISIPNHDKILDALRSGEYEQVPITQLPGVTVAGRATVAVNLLWALVLVLMVVKPG